LVPRSIVEVFIQCGIYAGLPASEDAMAVAEAVYAERGIELPPEAPRDDPIETLDRRGRALLEALHGDRGGTVNLSGRVTRMQASGSGHWGLLQTHATDFGPDLEFLGPGSSMLGGSDEIAGGRSAPFDRANSLHCARQSGVLR
jgi:hypothetical protein